MLGFLGYSHININKTKEFPLYRYRASAGFIIVSLSAENRDSLGNRLLGDEISAGAVVPVPFKEKSPINSGERRSTGEA
jgi:hypothetical protein